MLIVNYKMTIILQYNNSELFFSNNSHQIGADFALKILKWDDNLTIKLQLWDIAGIK